MRRLRRLGRGLAGPALLGLVVLALATLAAAPAQAQTLVSNANQADDSSRELGSRNIAQSFHTGSHAAGYVLKSIAIESEDDQGDNFAAYLHSSNGNAPGTQLHALDAPASFSAGSVEFTAPGTGIRLSANTDYFVVLHKAGVGDQTFVDLDSTSSNDEDPGRAAGWSIGDTTLLANNVGSGWSNFSDFESLRITVKGTAIEHDTPPSRSVASRFQFWERDSALGLLSGPGSQVHVPSVSQRFTTGSNVTAYRLEAVQIAIDLLSPSSRLTVHLHEDNDGLPGSRILRLDPLGSLRDGTMQFIPRQLSGEYPLLLPDTYYHIQFDSVGGGLYSAPTTTGGAAYLDVARTNDVAMNGGFGLDDHSLSCILRSAFNEAIRPEWGIIEYHDIPGGFLAARGEYGQSLIAEPVSNIGIRNIGGREVVHPGFDVTYGWNRMSKQLWMRLIGTAITGETPVFNLPPKPVSAAVVPTGNLLDIVFNNVPDDRAGRIPLPEHFTVTVDGAEEVAVSAVEVSGADKRVRLRLARMVKDDERVTVSYRDPGTGDNTAALQSPAGVDAPGFANYRVTNGSMIPSLRPAPVSATVPAAGNRVDIVFSHAPDDSAGRTPAPERFSVTADGMDITVSAVAVSGSDKRVRLTLSPTVKTLQAVAVSYRDPSAGDDAGALQSTAGSDARSFTDFPATNDSTLPDPAPKPVSATVPTAGNRVDIVFNHALEDGMGRIPARSRFTVTADGRTVPVDTIDISRSDMRVGLMLAHVVEGDLTVTVSYRDPSAGDDTAALQSPAGADAPSFSGYPVTNGSTAVDPAPRPTSATVPAKGLVIEMEFSQTLDDGSGRTPAASQFTVTVAGRNRAVTRVRVSGNRVRLDLPNFVDTGETVTVSYQDPSAGDDTASLQAAAGDDAPSFTDYPVTVASVGGAPLLRSAVTNSIVDGVLLLFDREIDTRSSKLPPTSAFSVVDDDGTQTITRLLAGELLTFLPDGCTSHL